MASWLFRCIECVSVNFTDTDHAQLVGEEEFITQVAHSKLYSSSTDVIKARYLKYQK